MKYFGKAEAIINLIELISPGSTNHDHFYILAVGSLVQVAGTIQFSAV